MDLKTLTKEAVRSYFEMEDGNLEEIISEIAKREELNNEEIARICQQSNVKIFLRLFKATDDKTVEFDVADPNNISGVMSQSFEKKPEFDEGDFKIETKEEAEEEELDVNKLVRLAQKLKDERDSLRVKLMENKPTIRKILKSKINNNNPRLAVYAIKRAGVSEDMIKEASGLNELPDISDINYAVEYDSEFLHKVASYGRMETRLEEVESKLEKLASILSKAVKKPFKAFDVVKHMGKAKDKTKDYTQQLKDNETKRDTVMISKTPNEPLYK